jgi:ribosome recycling factor-like protein
MKPVREEPHDLRRDEAHMPPAARRSDGAATPTSTSRSCSRARAIGEDEERRALDEVQKMADAHIQKVDQASKGKEKEILDIK